MDVIYKAGLTNEQSMTEQELQQYIIRQYPKEDEGCEWKEFKNLKNDFSGHEVKIVFKKKNKKDSDENGNVNGGSTGGIDVGSLSVVQLTERQKGIIKLIRENPLISSQQMSVVLSVVKRTIERDLADLQKKGVLNRSGNTSAGRWVLLKESE